MTARSSPPQPTLRQLRQARGWTQEQVARWLGVNQVTVSKWEHGVAVPRVRTRQRLADLFGVGVGAIIFGEDARP
jgi:transcriptional regulator with XRE-family HTH domain